VPFAAADSRLALFQPVNAAGSVFLSGEGGTTFSTGTNGFPLYFLGGPTRLGAYGTNELFGDQYYLIRAGYLHDLVALPPFLGKRVYAIATLETAKTFDFLLPTQSGFPMDASFGVLAETGLGPFFVGGSVGDSGHRKWFFQLGRVF